MNFKVNKFAVLAMGICTVACFTSCKSSESAYRKAFEKAQANETAQQTKNETVVKTDEPEPVRIAPVTTTTKPADNSANVATRSENLSVVDGEGLKEYSVVCGAFGLKANAQGLQKRLKDAGYAAQIAFNSERKLYRVIASTFDNRADAVASRDKLRRTYANDENISQAWLLYNK